MNRVGDQSVQREGAAGRQRTVKPRVRRGEADALWLRCPRCGVQAVLFVRAKAWCLRCGKRLRPCTGYAEPGIENRRIRGHPVQCVGDPADAADAGRVGG
jgi:ribosomal protein S27E